MPTHATSVSRSSRHARRPTPAAVESCESRVLFAIDVTVGTGSPAQAIVFTDGDGTSTQIRAAGGTATVTFDAPDVAQSTTGRLVNVTGTNVTMTNLVMGGANPNVAVRTAGGNGTVNLAAMSAAGPVRAFSGRGVILSGASTLNNGIGLLELSGAQGATLTINRSGQARLQDASVTILNAADTSITSQQPMRRLRVGNWGAGIPGQVDQVTTPRINVLQCGGDFNADLNISGNGQAVGRPVLGNALILGALASGEWNVAGRTSRVSAGSVAENWEGNFGDVSTFSAGNLAGDITANSINVLSANSISGSEITLTRPFAARATALNRLNVRGAVTDTDVRSNADIGTVSANTISGSSIFAGVQGGGDDLPTAGTAFVNLATIRNVTLRGQGAAVAYADTNIAAANLGRMNLGTVQVTNGGNPFGLAAQSVSSVAGRRNDTNEFARGVRLTEPTDSIFAGDFTVRVF